MGCYRQLQASLACWKGVRAQRTQRLVSSCYSVCAAGTCDQLHVTNNKHTQSMLPDHFPHRHINNICCAGSILYRASKTKAFVSVATRSSYLFTNENEKNASPPLKLSLIPSTFPNVLPSLFSLNIDIMIPILISPLNWAFLWFLKIKWEITAYESL